MPEYFKATKHFDAFYTSPYVNHEMEITCPLCGSTNVKKQFETAGWGIVACLTCTNAWTDPPPSKIEYADQDFHSKFPYTDVLDLPNQWKKGLMILADMLGRQLEPESKVLEIGCGQGILLKELARRGFDVSGIEPSKTASQAARAWGLNVTQGYFPEVLLSGQFDAVVMSHVLEHIGEPTELLKHTSRVAPGGLVVLGQTNWRGLMPRLYKEKWYAWVPEHHFWHFTPRGLSFILRKLKWEILEIEYSSLFHQSSIVSVVGAAIPRLGDQFHLLARTPGNEDTL